MKTTYVIQGYSKFQHRKTISLVANPPIQCLSKEQALSHLSILAKQYTGAIAASQEYNSKNGELGELSIFARFGEVPDLI
ncbi:MAG: hypothetical protein KBC57_05530 [Neisseriaceae bacterium]|nr:hypothetical protein [Neisseriaceae bacterium]MBP6861800.1 hypothetical protein [Neisseriaceae bacterium]